MRARVVWERKVLEPSVTTDAALLIRESCERFSTFSYYKHGTKRNITTPYLSLFL